MRRHSNPPPWVFKDAYLDLDFANNRYWGGHPSRKSIPEFNSIIGIQGGGTDNALGAPDIDNFITVYLQYTLRIVKGLGLWVEGITTNYALWCRDFTNVAWTKANITATKNQTGANGTANGASSLTATALNGTVLQTITLASAPFVVSAYVKRLVGSGVIEMTMDGGATWVDVTSQIGTAYSWVKIPTQTQLDPVVGFRIATSGDSIAVDFFQAEDSAYASTPLLTTTTTRTRPAEMATFNTTGVSAYNQGQRIIENVYFDTPASFFAEYCGNGNSLHGVTKGAPGWVMEGGADGGPVRFGHVLAGGATFAESANNGNFGIGNMNKAVGRIGGQGCAVCLNGGDIATGGAKPINDSYSHIGLGSNGAATAPMNGYFKRLTWWRRELTDGEMLELTR
jgi:hypothetical protein